MMFTNSSSFERNVSLLLFFVAADGALARTPVAELRGEVQPVAVRYDGWIPQHGGFNPSRCSVELRYGGVNSGVKAKGLFYYYPVHAQPYERKSTKSLSGEALTLEVYPTHVAFLANQGNTQETFEFLAGTNPADPSFWRMVNHIQFTATEQVAVETGEPHSVQTVIFDCQVSQVSWL